MEKIISWKFTWGIVSGPKLYLKIYFLSNMLSLGQYNGNYQITTSSSKTRKITHYLGWFLEKCIIIIIILICISSFFNKIVRTFKQLKDQKTQVPKSYSYKELGGQELFFMPPLTNLKQSDSLLEVIQRNLN